MLDALVYTDAAAHESADGRTGFQFIARSRGATAHDEAIARDRMQHAVPIALPAESWASHPQSCAFLNVNGRMYLSRGRSTGATLGGRPGNQLTITLMSSDAGDILPYRPAQLYSSPQWDLSRPDPGEISAWLTPAEISEDFELPALHRHVHEQPWAARALPELLTMLLETQAKRRRRLMIIHEEQALIMRWIALLSHFLDPEAALRLSFRVFAEHPISCDAHIIGAHPALMQGDPLAEGHAAGLNVIDLRAGTHSPIEPADETRAFAEWFLGGDPYEALAAIETSRRWAGLVCPAAAARAARATVLGTRPPIGLDDLSAALTTLRTLLERGMRDDIEACGDALADLIATSQPAGTSELLDIDRCARLAGDAGEGELERALTLTALEWAASSPALGSAWARARDEARGNAARGETAQDAARGDAAQSDAARNNAVQNEAPRGNAAQSKATRGDAAQGATRSSSAARGDAAQGNAARGEATRGNAAQGTAQSSNAAPGNAARDNTARGEAAREDTAHGDAARAVTQRTGRPQRTGPPPHAWPDPGEALPDADGLEPPSRAWPDPDAREHGERLLAAFIAQLPDGELPAALRLARTLGCCPGEERLAGDLRRLAAASAHDPASTRQFRGCAHEGRILRELVRALIGRFESGDAQALDALRAGAWSHLGETCEMASDARLEAWLSAARLPGMAPRERAQLLARAHLLVPSSAWPVFLLDGDDELAPDEVLAWIGAHGSIDPRLAQRLESLVADPGEASGWRRDGAARVLDALDPDRPVPGQAGALSRMAAEHQMVIRLLRCLPDDPRPHADAPLASLRAYERAHPGRLAAVYGQRIIGAAVREPRALTLAQAAPPAFDGDLGWAIEAGVRRGSLSFLAFALRLLDSGETRWERAAKHALDAVWDDRASEEARARLMAAAEERLSDEQRDALDRYVQRQRKGRLARGIIKTTASVASSLQARRERER